MGTTLTWKNVPIIQDGYRVKCGLLPISTSSFWIYFPSSNYCYQFLRYPSRDIVYRNTNQFSEFPYINPCGVTHKDVSIDVEEAEFEKSAETAQICHTPMIMLPAPSAKKNFPQTHHSEHKEIAPPGEDEKLQGLFTECHCMTSPEPGTCEHS